MIHTTEIFPGITLYHFPDSRFKQSCLSLQMVRLITKEEAAMNALLPAVLLRGCESAPDIRSITLKLDDLYGASIGAQVRRIGDYQLTGMYGSFIGDRYAMESEGLLTPVVEFMRSLLLEPLTENGGFRKDFVDGEKKNLIAAIQSQMNNKRAYASAQLLKDLCANDPFGLPRLGYEEDVAAIDPVTLYSHYRKILKESRIDLFYVGEQDPQVVADAIKTIFAGVDRDYVNLPAQTPFQGGKEGKRVETMEVAQGKLCMGFTTPINMKHPRYHAMRVFNTLFGGGMTCKLFQNIREKQSLCYDIGSGYYATKGLMTVSAGIDCDKDELVQELILGQLQDCCDGNITEEEMTSAKEALISSLQGVHDSPSAIEGYYLTGLLSGSPETPDDYIAGIRAVTKEDVMEAAKAVQLRCVYFLKGVQ
ncbi:MAG: insulinase family protein [Oscillospiraceae bacterium]|nr:insulinase family protein [Oscillospiraceae bacterium]